MLSMTGYGRASLLRDGREITVELKAVNHRFLDLGLRVPRGMLYLEDVLRKGLSRRLARGHVDAFVTYRNTRDDARAVRADTALLKAYGAALDQMKTALLLPDDRTLLRMAALPDVLTVSEAEEDVEAVSALCAEALDTACDALVAMRRHEGEALCQDLLGKLDRLEAFRQAALARAPRVVEAYRDRLLARVTELLDAPPDPQRIAQEVALMADRAAIDEELVRLDSHIRQARRCLALDEPVGRKLDFLVQEMNREVNTIGSKASDLEIGGAVVEAKTEIEKLREQVQNLE